jgi:hypothetical protein
MARLFNIEIPFQNKRYCALVSVRECEHNLNCQVRYIDKGLNEILPGDIIVFNLSEGLKQPKNLPNELARELVRCTSEAISNHFERPRVA